MTNLFKETIEKLERIHKTLEDIEWVGCSEFWIATDDFLEMAKNYKL
jgi:hypothetical protein